MKNMQSYSDNVSASPLLRGEVPTLEPLDEFDSMELPPDVLLAEAGLDAGSTSRSGDEGLTPESLIPEEGDERWVTRESEGERGLDRLN
jgi:hypothetical protein